MDGKTVFLTGGTGFVGMNIAQRMLAEGWDVILYARKAPDASFLEELKQLAGRLIFEAGDVRDQDRMEAILEKYQVDDFVHGAAITPDYEMERNHPAVILDVNCMGLLHGMLAAANKGIRRFLYLGSISAYGSTAFQEGVLEEGVSAGNPHSLYELSKFTGERLVLRIKELYSMNAYVVRIGDVYGPWERYTGVRGHMSLIYQTTAAAMRGESVILPRPCLQDWVSGPDIAGEVLAVLQAKKLNYDIYPFCSGERWSLLDWCRLLKGRYPEFSYELAEKPQEASIQVNQSRDNAPMQMDRLFKDTGYAPMQKDAESAFACYMKWLEEHPGFLK